MLGGVPLGWRIADAYLALVALAWLETMVVGALRFREFGGGYELGQATHGVTPIALAAAAPFAVAAGLVVEVVRGARHPLGRALAALLAGCFGGVAGYGVATGRHFEAGGRIPFAVGLGLAGAALAFALAPHLAALVAPRPTARWALALVLAVAGTASALEGLNALVLPRLYPAFHLGLGALAVAVAGFAALAFGALDARLGPRARRWAPVARVAVALGAFAYGAAGAQAAAHRLAQVDNIRIIYLDHAPLMAHVIELAAVLEPPKPLADETAPEARPPGGRAIDLAGHDLLLVTVDALRADHVGAYGYARPTTPNLDRLAAEGVVFEAAYSPTPHTSYAVTSLMTGKYMRPLVLQGLGADSETWADHLRRYGYRTAAFYPPAIFFIDAERFAGFRDRALDFEYRKVEFAPASARAEQVKAYLARLPVDRKAFVWVHLFEPHEPYEPHPEHVFGDRDVDRYDGEIAAADDGIGAVVSAMRAARPGTLVMVTADHGEEFYEHGGRYHGTTVFEEQVRVPLVVSAPGLFPAHRVESPVQLVDLLPTVLAGLDIPRPARVRGNDLGPLLAAKSEPSPGPSPAATPRPSPSPSPSPAPRGGLGPDEGFAFAETETQTLLAQGRRRLVCARRVGACALYDLATDPGELRDIAGANPALTAAMRAALRGVEASHGRYEEQGRRLEGKGWPEALRRGLAGDGDAAMDIAALLDDADVTIRREAAEVLFELRRVESAAAIRFAIVREEDDEVRRWSALALTRLGEGAPRTRDLLQDPDRRWQRLAALALAEQGDARGEPLLVGWLRDAFPPGSPVIPEPGKPLQPRRPGAPLSFERARELALALGKIRARAAFPSLVAALDDLRLRPTVASALALLGEDAGRPALAFYLARERFQTARVALAEALVKLGGGAELRGPLVRLLGTPDPLPDGLRMALDSDVLQFVGGPRERDLTRLRRFATSGVAVGLIVPQGGNGGGLRALCRVRSRTGQAGEVRVGLRLGPAPAHGDHDSPVPGAAPAIDKARSCVLPVPAGDGPRELFASLPGTVGVRPGDFGDFVIYATQDLDVLACAVVPLTDELPPPPPEPWIPSPDGDLEGTQGTPADGGAADRTGDRP